MKYYDIHYYLFQLLIFLLFIGLFLLVIKQLNKNISLGWIPIKPCIQNLYSFFHTAIIIEIPSKRTHKNISLKSYLIHYRSHFIHLKIWSSDYLRMQVLTCILTSEILRISPQKFWFSKSGVDPGICFLFFVSQCSKWVTLSIFFTMCGVFSSLIEV